jgi:transcriptional regulator with XRE-family HTH domain
MKIHQKQISTYERGRNTPSTGVLIKLVDIFDVSLDYLAFEAEGQSAKVNIKDRELLKRFEEIDKFREKDKETIKEILDTFILKNKLQSLAAPEQL